MIVIHGGDIGATGWLNYGPMLPTLASKFHVYLVDLPNYGKSGALRMNEPTDTVNARALRDLMDKLGIEQANIVGNTSSTRAFAIDYPERTLKIVTNGNAASGFTIFAPTPTEGNRLSAEANANVSFETMKAYCRVCLYNSDLATDKWVQARYESANNPEHLAAKRAASRGGRDILAESSKIRCPVLSIKGRDDRLGPIDNQLRLLFAIPDIRLLIFANCGHWSHIDKREEFAREVMSFLDS
jgi:pimeloyl-ACP methyl ester carboxylesterase